MFTWEGLVPTSAWIMSGGGVIGKNLTLSGGLLSFGCPRPLSLTPSFTGLFLGTVGHFLLLLLPRLRSNVTGIIDGVEFRVFRGRFLECDAHIGSKIILSLFWQQSPRESTGSCLDNIVFGAVCVFGHLLFELDDAIEEGAVRWMTRRRGQTDQRTGGQERDVKWYSPSFMPHSGCALARSP